MKFKNKLGGKVTQVDLQFLETESWLKSRKKVKESKCQNCKKLHKEEKYIVFAMVEGKMNAHLCRQCGLYFIEDGARDVRKARKQSELRKEKLIKQAKRLGKKFNTYYSKKEEEYSVQDLERLIISIIDSKRKEFKEYLQQPQHIRDRVREVTTLFSDSNQVTNQECFELWKNPNFFYDYTKDYDYDHHRWLSYFTAEQTIKDKVLIYNFATCSGDNSIEDQGFELREVWDSLQIVDYKNTITDTERLNWLIKNYSGGNRKKALFIDFSDLRNFIDEKM